MTVIKYDANDVVTLNVQHADNILLAYLSDSSTSRRSVYNRDTDYNPTLVDSIDLTPSLREAATPLLITGINFTGGGQMMFEIRINNRPVDGGSVEENLPENSSKSWLFSLEKA